MRREHGHRAVRRTLGTSPSRELAIASQEIYVDVNVNMCLHRSMEELAPDPPRRREQDQQDAAIGAGHTGAPDSVRYGIGELCAVFGVTARTLRHYESVGLLSPERRGQTRLYAPRDRARLALILKGKRFGFSLEEIGELLDLYDPGDGKRAQLERALDVGLGKLAELEARRAELDAVITDFRAQISLVQRLLADEADPPSPAAAP